MTLELSFAFTSFILVLSLFWLLKVCRRSKPHNIVQKSPPGPRKLPLIGNLHNLIGSLPHHALRKLAGKYGPLMHLQLGEISAIGVSSPRVTREVLKTNDLALRRDHNCLQVDQILGNVINDHRENQKSATTGNGELSREDFVDVLIGLQQSGSLGFPITNNHIKAVILDMFSAGTDTSSSTIDWAMSEMMRQPRVLEKAQAEIRRAFKGKKQIHEKDIQNFSYLKFVIKETLRRMCPGVTFGLANIELPLAQLLYHFDWELTGRMRPEDLDMTEFFGAVVRRVNNFPISEKKMVNYFIPFSRSDQGLDFSSRAPTMR
ncbi:premnaspirodiene oxygenase [Quercus suber]|uniref:Premnaspirodiene oxygenase n=1 Tax=Quercus suber TaxID=58331 RepID=A0AAW0M359_QUESU